MKTSTKADLNLIIVAILWGGTFPVIKSAMAYIDAYTFVFARFALGLLVLLPFAIKHFKETNRQLLIGCLVLGGLNDFIYIFQSNSMNYLSASRSAFITGTNVILVPLLAPLFKLGKMTARDLGCAMLCLIGLFILTDCDLNHLGKGDFFVFLTAIAVALYILYLQKVSMQEPNYWLFCFYQFLFTLPIPTVLALSQHNFSALLDSTVIRCILYCSLLATVLVFYLQGKYQKDTTATKAALIFCLEPVFATIFGAAFINEEITLSIIVGGCVMIGSIILAEVLKARRLV